MPRTNSAAGITTAIQAMKIMDRMRRLTPTWACPAMLPPPFQTIAAMTEINRQTAKNMFLISFSSRPF